MSFISKITPSFISSTVTKQHKLTEETKNYIIKTSTEIAKHVREVRNKPLQLRMDNNLNKVEHYNDKIMKMASGNNCDIKKALRNVTKLEINAQKMHDKMHGLFKGKAPEIINLSRVISKRICLDKNASKISGRDLCVSSLPNKTEQKKLKALLNIEDIRFTGKPESMKLIDAISIYECLKKDI